MNLPGFVGCGIHVHGFLHPAGVNPQSLQNCLHLIFAITPGGQFVPQDNLQRCFAHFLALYFTAPRIHGQQALVPDEMIIVTEPPPVKLQTLVAPIAPITVRGVATIEPSMTGGIYTEA